jgi:hypothetical protein
VDWLDAANSFKSVHEEPKLDVERQDKARLVGGVRIDPSVEGNELARLEFASILKRHVREHHVTRREMTAILKDFEEDEKNGVWQSVEHRCEVVV